MKPVSTGAWAAISSGCLGKPALRRRTFNGELYRPVREQAQIGKKEGGGCTLETFILKQHAFGARVTHNVACLFRISKKALSRLLTIS